MAEKNKAEKNITRIKATDTASKGAKSETPAVTKRVKATAVAGTNETEPKSNVFARIGGYFKGAWVELRQVRWPNRRATWGLTVAVILFSLFFVVLILLLDSLFKYLFELIIT